VQAYRDDDGWVFHIEAHIVGPERSLAKEERLTRRTTASRPRWGAAKSERTRYDRSWCAWALDLARGIGRCVNLTNLFSGSAAFFCCFL